MIHDRESSRRFFVEVWKKSAASGVESLEPLEKLVLAVIQEHPEYHALLDGDEESLQQEYTPESGIANPFLHMGMHIAIREQISSDRPAGIRKTCQDLMTRTESAHALEHRIMECLGEALWSAQRNNTLPDEAAYLECIKRKA